MMRFPLTPTFLWRAMLVGIVFAAGVVAGEVAPPEIPAGGQEITFKNGEKVRGTVLAVEKGRFQFEPFDAPAFSMPVARVESVRPLTDEEKAVGRAIADSQKLEHAEAMALLLPLLGGSGDESLMAAVRGEIARRETLHNRKISAVRDARREVFRKKFDDLAERKLWDEALDLALKDLEDYPSDPELLADAVMMQYRLHRQSAKPPVEFRSTQLDLLRKVNPKSSVVHGIDVEMNASTRSQLKWEQDREKFLAGALESAQKLYEAFQLDEARHVLTKALGFSPPAAQAVPLRKLLEKVEAEIAGGKADRKVLEAERQKQMREDVQGAVTRGQTMTEKQAKAADNRIRKKQGLPPN